MIAVGVFACGPLGVFASWQITGWQNPLENPVTESPLRMGKMSRQARPGATSAVLARRIATFA